MSDQHLSDLTFSALDLTPAVMQGIADAGFDRARQLIAHARTVVVLTGAGISAESGIPTFRGGMDALWKDFDPRTLATPEAFARDPETVTRWYDWRRLKCRDAIPNAAHVALALWERRLKEAGGRFTLLTQNTAPLHFDHHYAEQTGFGLGGRDVFPGSSFGLGVMVSEDLPKSGGLGTVGRHGWAGAAGTWYWVDPKEELVAILMIQRMSMAGPPIAISKDFETAVYQAIGD